MSIPEKHKMFKVMYLLRNKPFRDRVELCYDMYKRIVFYSFDVLSIH